MIDLDGVIFDFVHGFSSLAVALGVHDTIMYGQDQLEWHFPFQTKEVWSYIKRTDNWWLGLQPLVSPAEIEMINELVTGDDHIVYFITSRPDTAGTTNGGVDEAKYQAYESLRNLGIQVTPHEIYAIDGKSKGELCETLGVTVALDDNIRQLEDLKRWGITAVARTWPYNSEWDGERVDSVERFIREYVDGR